MRSPLRSLDGVLRPGDDGRIFYGWWLVLASAGATFLVGGLLNHAYGAYAVLLRQEFGWSKTVLSGAFALTRAENGLLGPLQGWLVDRFGPRNVMRFGVVVYGLGFMGFSQVDSLLSFYALFFAMALGSSFFGWVSVTVAVVSWFTRWRSTALALTATGFWAGGVAAPLVIWSLESFGWRSTAFGSGVLILAVGLPLTGLIRHRPEPYGLTPDGLPAAPAIADDGSEIDASEGEFTAREALRSVSFWLLSIGHGFGVLIASAVTLHLVLHLNEGLGYSLAVAGTVIALVTLMQVLGTLAGGVLGDRGNKRVLLVVTMLGHAVGLLLLAYATAFWMVIAFALVYGLSVGVRAPVLQAMRADYFGTRSFGTIQGFAAMIATVGASSGPLLAGFMADRTGSYELGFTILAVMGAVGSLVFLFAGEPRPPRRAARPAEQPPVAGVAAGDGAGGG